MSPRMRAKVGSAQRTLRTAGTIQRIRGLVGSSRHMLSPAAGFAQAILHRYTGRQAGQPSLDRVFQQPLPAVTLRPVYHQTQIHLAPRLALTAGGWPGPEALPPSVAPQRELITIMRLSRQEEPPPAVRLVQRLSNRGERIEMLPGDKNRPAASSGTRPRAAQPGEGTPPGPVPRIVRPPAVAPATPEMASPAGDSRSTVAHPGFPAPARTQPAGELASLDVNQLTDRVIQAIDRRIHAYRERRGGR